MSGETQRPAATRDRLNRDGVLKAALAVIDREGLDALSMRRLGAELGVDPMAVYRHVNGKDAVLDGVAELLWASLPDTTAAEADWASGLRDFARQIRGIFQAHPNAAPLLLQRPILPVPSLEKSGEQLKALERAGFEPSVAAEIVRTVTSFSTGYGLAEVACVAIGETGETWPETDRDMLLAIAQYLPPGTPARLADVAVTLWAGVDPDSSFESGLDLIIAGAQAKLERSRLPKDRPA